MKKARNNPFDKIRSAYGAPMGRRSDSIDIDGPLVAQRWRGDGCYDQGGAYWGIGAPIWAVYARGRFADGVAYVRAATADRAKATVRGDHEARASI